MNEFFGIWARMRLPRRTQSLLKLDNCRQSKKAHHQGLQRSVIRHAHEAQERYQRRHLGASNRKRGDQVIEPEHISEMWFKMLD